MLDKLSSALKRTTDKIANAIFLDKNILDSIIKDLQRALIEADVNVSLVLEISQKLKKAALDERIKGVEKKEHIIKILHDELLNILGDAKEIKLSKNQNIFMMLGLFGQGKCVHANTKIQLSNGNIKNIKQLYEESLSLNPQEKLEDGYIINLSNENIMVPSFNPETLKIENKKATHIWKLKKENLYEIYLDNGNDFSIKVTPEHPFFVLRNGRVLQIKAEEIKESDWIATPTAIEVQGKLIDLQDKIKKIPFSVQLTKEEVNKIIKDKKQNIKEICRGLEVKRNYCKLTSELKRGVIPIELIKTLSSVIIAKGKESKKFITTPTFLTADFAEFLGYVMGDGNIRPNYVQISNEDSEIIGRVKELSKVLFNIEPKIKLAKRTKKMYDIRICSKTLVEIMSLFNLFPGRKGKNLKIPQEILLSNNETVRSFTKAYFDCDSYACLDYRNIELISESQIIIQQFNMLLKRFGIISTISKKIVNNAPYWRLNIKARYAEKYAEKIGFLIKHKRIRADKYKDMGRIQGCGNQDMIPLGKILKEWRQALGFSIGEIQDYSVNSLGSYEEKGWISKEKLKNLAGYFLLNKKGLYLRVLEDIKNDVNIQNKHGKYLANGIKSYLHNSGLTETKENKVILSNIGQKYLQQIKKSNSEEIIQTSLNLADSDISWRPVTRINKTLNEEEYVYDLTVEDNHSFIAEGFIVHNTTTISKLALYYSKRGSKVCAIGLDVHRPAASEQLKQLMEKQNLPAFIDTKEKNPVKIWKKYEKELSKYNLILVDTAGRDALDSALIKEIKEINKAVKPTETFLVMSADIGQTAKKQAQTFKDSVKITGIIITKMDSTAKAGGALTACYETKVPVAFIGTGEKPHDLELFNPKSFLSRLLGMGDLESLIEKVKSAADPKKLEEAQKRLSEGKLTIEDVISQVSSMNQMGGMDKLLDLVPGLGKAKDKIPTQQLEQQQEKLKRWEHIAKSMTIKEKNNPELLEKQTSRIQRIAKGSGTSTTDVRMLIKQYRMLQDLVKSQSQLSEGKLDQKTLMKMAKKLGKKKMIRF